MTKGCLEKLAHRLRISGAEIVTADEFFGWNKGARDELLNKGILRQTENAKGVKCIECEEACFIEPEIRTDPATKKAVGVYMCEMGRLEIALNRLRCWRINKAKLIELGYYEEPEESTRQNQKREKSTKPLNVRVANAIIKHQNANSEEIARMIGSTDGSVRTTPAWEMRKQLRERYDSVKGWKDKDGNYDAFDSSEIKPEHWQIYEMFQKYKSESNVDYPSIDVIAKKLDTTHTEAKRLIKEAQSMLNFSADMMS